jgi:hypothetical protein
MINFNEIHGFFFDFQATLPATVCYCITADDTLALYLLQCSSVSVDFVFIVIVGLNKNSYHIFFRYQEYS